jgi:hypothetical protein
LLGRRMKRAHSDWLLPRCCVVWNFFHVAVNVDGARKVVGEEIVPLCPSRMV